MKTIIRVIFVLLYFFPIVVNAKELYEIFEIRDLREQHDGKPVAVFGTINDIEIIRGRLGSRSTLLTITEENGTSIPVVALFELKASIIHRPIFIQGKYVRHCWVGGIRNLDACIRIEYMGIQ